MLNLNLLPPAEKEHLAYAIRTRAVIAVGGATTAVLLVFLVLLLPTFFAIVLQRSEIVRALDLERRSQEQTGITARVERIRAADRLADQVVRYEAERLAVAPLFQAVIRAVPSAVRIRAVSFRADRRDLTLEGHAAARSDLLEFTRILGDDPHIAKVFSPVSNLIRETDINFVLSATLR